MRTEAHIESGAWSHAAPMALSVDRCGTSSKNIGGNSLRLGLHWGPCARRATWREVHAATKIVEVVAIPLFLALGLRLDHSSVDGQTEGASSHGSQLTHHDILGDAGKSVILRVDRSLEQDFDGLLERATH